MPGWIEPVVLEGEHVRLVPLEEQHLAALNEAAADGELWKLWFTAVPKPEDAATYIANALHMRDQLDAMPFAVILKQDGKMVGSTRYFNVDKVNRRLEIGHTWYSKRVQRSAVNSECKLLLLSHAFESLHCIAVEFRTHWMNHKSRAAIARLGAKQDGVLRNHQIGADGTLRDTVVFSIIASEWPTVRYSLKHGLSRTAC